MDFQTLLDYQFQGISIIRWTLIVVIVLAAVLVLGGLKRLLLRRIVSLSEEHEDVQWLNYAEAMFGKNKLALYLAVGLFAGLELFDVATRYASTGRDVVQVLVIVQFGVWASAAATVLIDGLKERIEDDPAQVTALSAINFIVDAVVWSLVVLLALDNLGFDITALIASLGIGGVAVALAAQKILGDLFAFFSIIVDKPFLRGDFIVVDDFAGTVEHIGIKTTRLRSLEGEQIVFSNEDLLDSRIQNFKRMKDRRVVLEFGLTYETSPAEIETVTDVVEQIVRDQSEARFERAHFTELGDSALNFEVAYAVTSPEFDVHMDVRQNILTSLMKELRAREISFAFPTRTVHLDDQDAARDAA